MYLKNICYSYSILENIPPSLLPNFFIELSECNLHMVLHKSLFFFLFSLFSVYIVFIPNWKRGKVSPYYLPTTYILNYLYCLFHANPFSIYIILEYFYKYSLKEKKVTTLLVVYVKYRYRQYNRSSAMIHGCPLINTRMDKSVFILGSNFLLVLDLTHFERVQLFVGQTFFDRTLRLIQCKEQNWRKWWGDFYNRAAGIISFQY